MTGESVPVRKSLDRTNSVPVCLESSCCDKMKDFVGGREIGERVKNANTKTADHECVQVCGISFLLSMVGMTVLEFKVS